MEITKKLHDKPGQSCYQLHLTMTRKLRNVFPL
jgi:hypothetical protein